jgi:neutral ceramidase
MMLHLPRLRIVAAWLATITQMALFARGSSVTSADSEARTRGWNRRARWSIGLRTWNVWLVVLWFPFGAAAAEPVMRIGRAQVRITPPLGAVIGNSYGIAIAVGKHSELHAKAIAFESGGIRAAVVSCDLISLHRPIVAEVRRLIRERTGIPPEHVILSATHCHAGPQTHPMFLEVVGGEAQKISETYLAELPGKIAESVRLAEADLQFARLYAGTAREEGLAFNRRWLLRNGTVDTNPGRRNPDAIRPMGPVDPEISILYAETKNGRPLVTHVNFALHARRHD